MYYTDPQVNDNTNDEDNVLNQFEKMQFDKLHDQHWQIEQYHRTIKQVCNIESVLGSHKNDDAGPALTDDEVKARDDDPEKQRPLESTFSVKPGSCS